MNNKDEKIFIGIGATAIAITILYFIFSDSKDNNEMKQPKSKTAQPLKILFIGDSLTAGFGLDGKSFVEKIQSANPNISTKKIAVTGKQTGWMLEQLEKELANNKYDVITIWGGVNDIYAKDWIDNAEANLQRMYNIVKKSGAKLVAINTIPTATYPKATNRKIKLTNELNNWIAENKTPDFIIDVNSIVSDGKGGTSKQNLQDDKLHLSDSAQQLLANKFSEKVL